MRKRNPSTLGPGSNYLFQGIGGLLAIIFFLFVVIPFFFSRNDDAGKKQIVVKVFDTSTGSPVAEATLLTDSKSIVQFDTSGILTTTKNILNGQIKVVAPGFITAPFPSIEEMSIITITLQPNLLNGQLLDLDTQKPIVSENAIQYNGKSYQTNPEGKFTIPQVSEKYKLKVAVTGFEKIEQSVDTSQLDTTMVLSVRSTVLNGQIADSETSKGVPNALVTIITETEVTSSPTSVLTPSASGNLAVSGNITGTTDRTGKYTIYDAPRNPGTKIKVRAPGYKIQTFSLEDAKKGIKLIPFHFQGVYVPGILALKSNYDKLFTPYLELAKQGKINAIVVDMKHDDTGKLLYDSKLPLANELSTIYDLNGLKRSDLIDVKKLLEDSHKVGLYVVARMVTFRDPALAKAKPEWTLINRITGKPWLDSSDLTWPNPLIPEVENYEDSVAKEIASLGFDEVQLDYVRFPTDGKLSEVDYGNGLSWSVLGKTGNEKMRTEPIERTVKNVYESLRYSDTFFSLDVFGYSLWLNDDVGIGQQYDNLVMLSDYICPMVYPSHFDPGTLSFDNPGLHPGEIISESGRISNKLEAKLPTIAKYRPWLEDFPKNYGPKELQYSNTPESVKLQINAALALGASGFTLWNAAGIFSESALPPTK